MFNSPPPFFFKISIITAPSKASMSIPDVRCDIVLYEEIATNHTKVD